MQQIKLEIIEKDGQVKVTSPYNQKFVNKARNLRGKWKDDAWWFDDSIIDYVRDLMMDCFNTTGEVPYEVVDGFHRYSLINPESKHFSKRIYDREGGCLPVVVIDKDESNRMASTIRHNRARGTHSIELMVNIVKELVETGMSDAWILKNIGMDADELLRLKQVSGLISLFRGKEFSESEE